MTELDYAYLEARKMMQREYKISAGSHINRKDGKAYVCSVESYGPATYGHPKAEICIWVDDTGHISAHSSGVKNWR